ncbi:MAG: response regulator, partial [Bacteroidales bacterium]|nr:response regulator [Bacteroidales bacterium]
TGMIEVLQQTELSEEQYEYLEIINNSANSLLTVIDDILDFSKLGTGEIELYPSEFQLNREVDYVHSIQIMKAQGKGISLNTIIDEDVPQALLGDAYRLKQVLNNLVNNAIKYTKEGSVKIHISIDSINKEEALLRFTIMDTGIGIQPDSELLLKQVLSEETSLTGFSYGGIGLGLSISKSLISLMGGEIGFNTKYKQGSQFWFTTKFKLVDDIEKEIEIKPTKKFETKTHSILLVEDNVLNQKFASATLRREGHQVDIAENGKIALQKLENKTYDLILMDVQMPVMDGIEATLNIREQERRDGKIPVRIIAVTAYALDRDRENCLNAGMDDFLAKPFKPNDLIKMIENLNL